MEDRLPASDLGRLRAVIDETSARGESRLPPEPRLSEDLGVTRGRLRTMLRQLEQEGLLWRHVGKGTFIGPRQAAGTPTISASFSVGDIFDARIAFEPQLAAAAALHSTSEDIAVMDACLTEMRSPVSFAEWKRLDERLHREIAKAAHNILMLTLYDTLRAQTKVTLDRRLENVFGTEAGPKADADNEHQLLVEAIRGHDPAGAEAAMRGHLRGVRDKLFGLR